MFKFATNKFNAAASSSSNNNNASSQPNGETTRLDDLPTSTSSTSSAASRRRMIQKDLFAFNKIADKGFPSKPSAMDYDKKLKLLALGTKNGDIRIYGTPGSQQQQLSCYQDVHPFPIQRILFVQGQHQLITLSERVHRNDQTNKGESLLYLVLWQIPNELKQGQQSSLVEKIKEYQLDPKAINGSKLSVMTLLNDNSHLFLGFESGDVYVFNVSAFQLVPGVINKDYILKNLPEKESTNTQSVKKLSSLGAVESICHHPRQLTKLLLAYQRGLWVIFDFIKNQIDQINQTSQQLESAVFYQAGECVATAHSDGSFILWDLETSMSSSPASSSSSPHPASSSSTIPSCSSNSAPNIVYGPYPCKPVQKCLVKTCRNDQPLVIFSGGCPRVNYSDKVTISVIQGENLHVCFDFTSKIIDYFTIDKPSLEKPNLTYDNPQALFVLLEEEFVAIDLTSEGWPQFKLPYLYSVHSSAIICTHHVNNVARNFYESLNYYSNLAQEIGESFSENEWPVGAASNGGNNAELLSPNGKNGKDLLLTGHEDGTIRFWDVTAMSMQLVYKLKTCDYFQTDSTQLDEDADQSGDGHGNSNEDNWPPFRKVGTFDPYSDDPKLGIQKLYLCPQREVLVIAGTAGQVLIMHINDKPKELLASSINTHKINLIGVSPEVESHFVWKGHEPLTTRSPNAIIKLNAGYQLHSLVQLYPPATISALALHTDWQLCAMGTSHGFALFDYLQNKPLHIRCTLDPAVLLQAQNPNDSGGNMISRRKSLKKSLRESFRKLRRGRSQKVPNQRNQHNNATMLTRLNAIPNSSQMRVEHIDDDDMGGHKPVERQVESREFKQLDDIPPSVIRYMYFVRTFITSSQQQTNSLWVGTNTGIIYIYALQFHNQPPQQQLQGIKQPPVQTRTNQAINCLLAKEMRLKHRAPVVHIQVIDQNMQPLPNGDDPSTQSINNNQATNHKVIICSEEQFKVFQLPTLKPFCKFKLTAVEGARVRRIAYNSYQSRSDPKYNEYCLSCLSNLGDLSVYSLPQLKRQVQIQCMKQQDINAITSFVFSKQGQAFYLQSPSEFVHISMSARDTPQQLAVTSSSNSNGAVKSSTTNNGNRNPSPKKPQQRSTSNNNNPAVNPAKPVQKQPSFDQQQVVAAPPPVPTPRTTVQLSKEELTNNSSRQTNLKKQDSLNSGIESVGVADQAKPLTKEAITLSNSSLKPSGNLNSMQHSTPTTRNTIALDASPIPRPNTDTESNDEQMKLEDQSKCEEKTENDETKNQVSTTNSGISLTSGLNQSSISSSTVSHASATTPQQNNSGSTNLNNNNLSIITTAQSDSFNVSSSGYNGSSGATTIDLSMDSIVDRFNDEFQDLSSKIPAVIDEHDSLLETNETKVKTSTLNGQINYALTADAESTARKPQNSSSPFGSNKNEQVTTKRMIENGSKPEYRETVID